MVYKRYLKGIFNNDFTHSTVNTILQHLQILTGYSPMQYPGVILISKTAILAIGSGLTIPSRIICKGSTQN